jgi:phage N-6-adenine-methyltransferase
MAGYIATSKTVNWATPQHLYEQLNNEFHFEIDAAADSTNAKCAIYFDEQTDGLKQEWNRNTWINPPYGRVIYDWVKRAYEQSNKHGVTIALLIPSRTDTKWFHDYALKGEVRFLRGRLKFGNSTTSAPFPSIVVIFRGQ